MRAELIAAAVAMLAEPQSVAVPSLRSIARACKVAPSAVLDAEYADMIIEVEHASADVREGVQGLVSLRIHKTNVDWQLSPAEAAARIVTALCGPA